jgi:hypothetical protein
MRELAGLFAGCATNKLNEVPDTMFATKDKPGEGQLAPDLPSAGQPKE